MAPFSRLNVSMVGVAVSNATVDVVGGPSGLTGGASLALPDGTTSVQLTVRRVNDSLSVMAPLSVVDGCGSWNTFVGGGVGAFYPRTCRESVRPLTV